MTDSVKTICRLFSECTPAGMSDERVYACYITPEAMGQIIAEATHMRHEIGILEKQLETARERIEKLTED